jgi:type IV conjugative transfer system protein TraL
MSLKSHIILNHVDTPLRILFWSKGELLAFLCPLVGGLLFEEMLAGFAITALNLWFRRQYKKRFGKGQLQAVLYWYLLSPRKLAAIPPSYIRLYVM